MRRSTALVIPIRCYYSWDDQVKANWEGKRTQICCSSITVPFHTIDRSSPIEWNESMQKNRSIHHFRKSKTRNTWLVTCFCVCFFFFFYLFKYIFPLNRIEAIRGPTMPSITDDFITQQQHNRHYTHISHNKNAYIYDVSDKIAIHKEPTVDGYIWESRLVAGSNQQLATTAAEHKTGLYLFNAFYYVFIFFFLLFFFSFYLSFRTFRAFMENK